MAVCGETTPRVRMIPATPVTVRGVVTVWPSSVTRSPAGSVLKVIRAVRGTTSWKSEWVSPCESRTVRWIR